MKETQITASANFGTNRHAEKECGNQEKASFGAELCWLRHSKGYKQIQFAKLLKISEKELRNLEKGSPLSTEILVRINTALIANGWSAEAAELLTCAGHVVPRHRTMDSMDFDSLAGTLRAADERVIKSIRASNREFFSENELAQDHSDLLSASLRKGGFDLPEFIAKIQDARFLEKLSKTISPRLCVQVGEVSNGRFGSIQFVHDGQCPNQEQDHT
jgi:transcriptional regulator with XRE-family HTH domain